MQYEKTMIFMATSVAFMFLALFVGIFRLMSSNLFGMGIFVGLYGLHSIIMVFGFLPVIIMTERVAGIQTIPEAHKLKAQVTMVPSIILGVVAETMGYLWNFPILRFLGAMMLAVGCVIFIVTLKFLRTKSEAKPPFDFMILSVGSLLLAVIVSAFRLPVDDMGSIMLLISFPILFILGERIELTRIVSGTKRNGHFRRASVVAATSIGLFAVGSGEGFGQLAILSFLTGSILLLSVSVSVFVAESQTLRLLLRSPRPLQRYVSGHVLVAYAWAVIGLILAVAYSLSGFELDLYDPFIHSLTVGFIGMMMLAHGPVILPGLLKRNFDERKLTVLPLVVLTVSLVVRVAGGILLLVTYSPIMRLIVSFSGWLLLAAVLIFLRSMITGIMEPNLKVSTPS